MPSPRHGRKSTFRGQALPVPVHDRSGEDIGRVLAEHGLVISELSPISSSLEEIFFQLTGEPGTVE